MRYSYVLYRVNLKVNANIWQNFKDYVQFVGFLVMEVEMVAHLIWFHLKLFEASEAWLFFRLKLEFRKKGLAL